MVNLLEHLLSFWLGLIAYFSGRRKREGRFNWGRGLSRSWRRSGPRKWKPAHPQIQFDQRTAQKWKCQTYLKKNFWKVLKSPKIKCYQKFAHSKNICLLILISQLRNIIYNERSFFKQLNAEEWRKKCFGGVETICWRTRLKVEVNCSGIVFIDGWK